MFKHKPRKILQKGLNTMFKLYNRRKAKLGWFHEEITGPNGLYSTDWRRAKKDCMLEINVYGPAMEEFYPVKNGHALNFSIWYDIVRAYFLGKGGEDGYEYPAEIHEPTDKPFSIKKRPMKKDELEDFYQKFVDELGYFPDPGLRATLRQDLDKYHSYALESLPGVWGKHFSKKAIYS